MAVVKGENSGGGNAAPESAGTHDAGDGGWAVESASSQQVVESPVGDSDSTLESASAPTKPAPKAAVPAVAGAKKPAAAGTPVVTDDDVEAVESASAGAKKPAAAASPAVDDAGKSGSLASRRAKLIKEIDTLSYNRQKTRDQITADQATLTRVRAELAQVNTKLGKPPASGDAGKPAGQVTAPAGDKKLPERPKMPSYRAYATDEEYEKALETWQADDAKWLEARDTFLEERITGSVNASRANDRAVAEATNAAHAVAERVEAAKAKYADWNEKLPALNEIVSPWADPSKGIKAPFLSDLVSSTEDSGEILYWLMNNPDEGQSFAALLPNKALRDAFVNAPSPLALVKHFATAEGRAEFDQLKAMHPDKTKVLIGALSARLEPAHDGGSGAETQEPVTAANPTSKLPVGTPRAPASPGSASPTKKSFEDWMADEDAKETAERRKASGLAAAAP